MVKSLLLTLIILYSKMVYADIVCSENKCKEFTYHKKGSALINFKASHHESLKPDTKKQQDKNYMFANSKSRYNDLKEVDIIEGKCLIGEIKKELIFYKIIKKKKDLIKVVIEREDHDYSLRVSTIFWNDLDETKHFRQLKKWNCKNTPNLYNKDYVDKCIGDSSFGIKLCDPPRFFK